MKILTLLLCGVLSTSAFAQPAPQSGYETLVAAGKLILPGENGNPSTFDANLSPQENLRRQRLAVARNAPALKLLREGLKQPIAAPRLAADFSNLDILGYDSLREMARQLRQESDVRLADGDIAGALDSRLTILELGAAITRDAPLLSALTGAAIEAIGRKDFEVVGAKLDAPQIRGALERLKAIDARRSTYAETLQVERRGALNAVAVTFKEFLTSDRMKKFLATPEGRKELQMTEAEAREAIALTPETLAAQISAAFDAFTALAQLPYPRALQTKIPRPTNPVVGAVTDFWRGSQDRFSNERNRAQDRLLQSALELRALKLETGAYPATFATPLDPFSDNQPLVYKREGEGYLLYSLGPDGKDDGGSELQTIETNRETGAKTVTTRLRPESLGDILAPVF